jgi:hypothetical protein
MVQQTVRFTVDLTINEGKLAAFETLAQAMISRPTPTRMLCWRT